MNAAGGEISHLIVYNGWAERFGKNLAGPDDLDIVGDTTHIPKRSPGSGLILMRQWSYGCR